MKSSSPAKATDCTGRQQGFTLLEVLVAFVLLSLTLGVILQIFSGGLRNAAAAGHYAQAAIIADSKLAMLGSEFPLIEGESHGEEGNYQWRLTIEPYHDTDELNNPTTGSNQLYAITFWVRWEHGSTNPELQFNTYRLGVADGF